MEGGANARFKVVDGALYQLFKRSWSGTESETVALVSVPGGKKGTLTLASDMKEISMLTIKDSGYGLNECTSITAYAMEGENEKYTVVNGALFSYTTRYVYDDAGNSSQLPTLKLISVPAGMTGTFVMPKDVVERNVEDNAFRNSHLDVLMFEEGREKELEAATGYARWMYYMTTVKTIVLSVDMLEISSYAGNVFANWTSEQTICFTDSEEAVKAAYPSIDFDSLSATVVYDYQASQG